MRRILIVLPLILFMTGAFSQSLKYRKAPAFKPGEELKYRLRYGFITAAEGTLNVLDSDIKFNGHPVYHLLVQGRTSASFNLFYKVRNRYDSYIDRTTLVPYLYTEEIREANYRRQDKVRFNQTANTVTGRKGTFPARDMTFDLVSSFYFARSLDLAGIRVGTEFTIPYFLDDEVSELQITYVGKEQIKTAIGTFNCLKFNPSIKPGRIFKKDSKLYLWITDDGNRIPVKAQVEILVGSVTLELTSAKGLLH